MSSKLLWTLDTFRHLWSCHPHYLSWWNPAQNCLKFEYQKILRGNVHYDERKNKQNSYLGLYLFSFLQWYFSCLFQGHLICTGCEDPNQKESLAVETTADTGATTKTKTTNQGEQGATAVPVGNATEGGRMGLPLLLEEEEEEQGSGDMVWVQSPNFLDISYTCNDVVMGVLNWLYCVCVLFCFFSFAGVPWGCVYQPPSQPSSS